MSENYLLPDQPSSLSVTVLAWIFIVLFGIFVLAGIAYLGMAGLEGTNPKDKWLLLGIGLGSLLISVFILITSIGLFKRCNWARWCSIGIMALFDFLLIYIMSDPWLAFAIILFAVPIIVLSIIFTFILFSKSVRAEFGVD